MLLHPISSWSVIATKQTLKSDLMGKADIFKNLYWQVKKYHHMKTFVLPQMLINGTKKEKGLEGGHNTCKISPKKGESILHSSKE